ncbi:MAG: DUF1365 domain-containing protein [Actinomycetota bacterium]|nr:DUF1365 domain-containing protein [Actinomycetota bacterium]
MTASCIYEGTIRHRRAEPRREFTHRLALAYVDLDELPELLDGRLLRNTPGLVRFRRDDYLGDPDSSLRCAVSDLVDNQTGTRPGGPIRLLTQLRSYGHFFSPVSFYYCLDAGGERLEAVVAEVTNTPWGERHAYVLGGSSSGQGVLRAEFGKELHVSPFMGMDHRYELRATIPAETASVHIRSRRAGATTFDATLSLRRRELSRASIAGITARYPFATVRVLALIYRHALGLKLAGAPVHPPPRVRRA